MCRVGLPGELLLKFGDGSVLVFNGDFEFRRLFVRFFDSGRTAFLPIVEVPGPVGRDIFSRSLRQAPKPFPFVGAAVGPDIRAPPGRKPVEPLPFIAAPVRPREGASPAERLIPPFDEVRVFCRESKN